MATLVPTAGVFAGLQNIGTTQRARAFGTLNGVQLLGAASIVINNGANYVTPTIVVAGFNSFQLTITSTGTIALSYQHMDPDDGSMIFNQSLGNILVGSSLVNFGAFAGTGAAQVWALVSLKFNNASGANQTLSLARFWCGAR